MINTYIYIGKFNVRTSVCLEKKKSGRGDWGEGADTGHICGALYNMT